MKRLLILSRYDRQGASSRLRSLQYLPWLEAAGFAVQVQPLFDARYLTQLYAGGGRDGLGIACAYGNRLRHLRHSPPPDLIWLEKELLPWLPAGVESLFLPRHVPVVCDYDDALFHRYDLHRNPLVRRLFGRKIDRVMAGSAMVFAGNGYLAARALQAGAEQVELVPTVVDLDHYADTMARSQDAMPRLGWIGSRSTYQRYLRPMMPLFLEIAAQHGALLRLVGSDAAAAAGLECLPWSEAAEAEMIRGIDIGLMPLDHDPWSLGKCGYKILQYMACAVPVVASRIGANCQIVEESVTGFLVSDAAEWRGAIARLMADPALWRRMGQAGRQRVEALYTVQRWGPRVAALLASVLR